MNTIENILCAMLVLQRAMWLNKVKRVLLVTAPFHMRRSILIARYFFPKHIEICPCPAGNMERQRASWMEDTHTYELVMGEARNLLMYIHNGVMPDFEI